MIQVSFAFVFSTKEILSIFESVPVHLFFLYKIIMPNETYLIICFTL